MLIMVAVIGSAKFHTDTPARDHPAHAREKGCPRSIGAILMGGIFAKVISTAEQLFVLAGDESDSRCLRALHQSACDREAEADCVALLVVGLGIFALLQASQFESVLKAALYAYTIYGAAVTPVVHGRVFLEAHDHGGGMVSSIIWGPL